MLIMVWPFLSFRVSHIWSYHTLYCGHAECTRLVIVLIKDISGKGFNKFGIYKKSNLNIKELK